MEKKQEDNVVLGTMGWKMSVVKLDGCGNGAGNNSEVYSFVDTDLVDNPVETEKAAWAAIDNELAYEKEHGNYPYNYVMCLNIPNYGDVQVGTMDEVNREILMGVYVEDLSEFPVRTMDDYRNDMKEKVSTKMQDKISEVVNKSLHGQKPKGNLSIKTQKM